MGEKVKLGSKTFYFREVVDIVCKISYCDLEFTLTPRLQQVPSLYQQIIMCVCYYLSSPY